MNTAFVLTGFSPTGCLLRQATLHDTLLWSPSDNFVLAACLWSVCVQDNSKISGWISIKLEASTRDDQAYEIKRPDLA